MAWITPKTDWTNTDRFEYTDFNRIKNNIQYLRDRAASLIKSFEIESMGDDMTSYSDYWKVDYFNAIERNLNTIAQNTYGKDYGYSKTFYANQSFITFDELNRIESAMLDMYNLMGRQAIGLRKIPFVLGRFREVRV